MEDVLLRMDSTTPGADLRESPIQWNDFVKFDLI